MPAGGRRLVGEALALAATVMWSGGFLLARRLRGDVPPVALNFWRWALATAAIAPFTVRSAAASWPAIRRHWPQLLVTAVLGVTVYNTLVYVAGHSTQAVNLSLLGVASPIFILVFAHAFGVESVTPRRVFGVVVAAAGVVLLISGGSVRTLTSLNLRVGDLWMLAATAVFAGYSILVRRRPADVPTPAFLLVTFAAGTLLTVPAYLVELAAVGPFQLTAPAAGGLLYLGLGASAVAFPAWNRAIDLAGATRPAVIYYLIPVFTAVGGAAFLHERIHLADLLSMALILGGTAIGTLGRSPGVDERGSRGATDAGPRPGEPPAPQRGSPPRLPR